MRRPPTIGLAVIAKNEAKTLPTLLASIEGAFDQVVLLDTGSIDRTIDVFTEWAERQRLPLGCVVDTFEWVDDFSAARNAADALLETDWECVGDCDDIVHGAEHLRSVVAHVPTDLLVLATLFRESPETPYYPRERVFRRGAGSWVGRAWETRQLQVAGSQSSFGLIDPSLVRWVHQRDPDRPSSEIRNMLILQRWAEEEPTDPEPHRCMARTYIVKDDLVAAVGSARRYVQLLERRRRVPPMVRVAFDILDGYLERGWSSAEKSALAAGTGVPVSDIDHTLPRILLGAVIQWHFAITAITEHAGPVSRSDCAKNQVMRIDLEAIKRSSTATM